MSGKQEAVGKAVAAFNAGDLETYMELYDRSATLHGYAAEPIGYDGGKAFYSGLLSAFSGANLEADDVLEDGDKLCVRFHLTGTHTGELMGVQPTGRDILLNGLTIMRFEGNKVVERWQSADMLGLLTQIGAIPAPA